MNKLFKKLSSIFLGLCMAVGVGTAIGTSVKASEVGASTTYTMTIDSSSNGSNNVHWTSTSQESLTYNSVTWSTSVSGNASITSSTTQCQIGSKSNPATGVTIETSAFAGKKIVSASITGFCMSNTGPVVSIYAGATTMLSNKLLIKTTSTKYSSSTGNVTLGTNEKVRFVFTSSAKAAIVISELTVVYDNASTPITSIELSGTGVTGTNPNYYIDVKSSELSAKTINIALDPTDAADQVVNIAHSSGTSELFILGSSSATCVSGVGSFTITGTGATSGNEVFAISGHTETSVISYLTVNAVDDSKTYYDVTFNSNGGSISPTKQSIEDGHTFTFPSPGTKEHHTFNGWSSDGGVNLYNIGATSPTVTSAIQYTAYWTEDAKYTVTYTAGEHGSGSDYVVNNVYAGSYTLVAFATTGLSADSGYKFNDYTVDGVNKNPGDSITISANTTVTVNFKFNVLAFVERCTSISDIDTLNLYFLSNDGINFAAGTPTSVTADKQLSSTTDGSLAFAFRFVETTNGYSIKFDGYNSYLNNASSTNLSANDSASSDWTVNTYNSGVILKNYSNSNRHLGVQKSSELSTTPIKAYASTNIETNLPVYIYKYVNRDPEISINKSSVSGFIGTPDTSTTITCKNFNPTSITFEYADGGTSESEHISSSSYISIASSLNDKIYSLTITFIGQGSTNVKINVSGATLDPLYLDVTSYAVPNSISINGGSSREIELNKYIAPGVTIKDADNNDVIGATFSREITSENPVGCVSLSGETRITGESVGEAEITYTAVVNGQTFSDVQAVLSVSVLEDYIDTVKTVTFNSGLVANQGDEITAAKAAEIFNEHKGIYHFSKTEADIPYSDFLYSYTNSRASASGTFFLNQSISEVTTETVYVFHQHDTSFASSFTIDVTPQVVAITSIVVSNAGVTGNYEDGFEINANRNSILNIDASVLPETTTQSKELSFSIFEQTKSGATLNGSTLSVGSKLGNVIDIYIESVGNTSISTFLEVTVTREVQSISVNEPLTYQKVTSAPTNWVGEYLIVYEASATSGYIFNGRDAANDYVTGLINGDKITISEGDINTYKINIEAGSETGKYYFKTNNPADSSKPYFFGGTDNGMTFSGSGTNSSIELDTSSNNVLIKNNDSTTFAFNTTSGQNRYRYYKNSTISGQSTTYLYPTLYKKIGGLSVKSIDDSLFNAVEGANTCFTCNASGSIKFTSEKTWSDVASYFTSLSSDNKYILKYGVKNENGNEVESFLAKYDYIVGKYGTSTYSDFLERSPSKIGGSNLHSIVNITSNSSTIIIVVISLVSLTAIGGYFFVRRRKETN